jgi:hypothetical protein
MLNRKRHRCDSDNFENSINNKINNEKTHNFQENAFTQGLGMLNQTNSNMVPISIDPENLRTPKFDSSDFIFNQYINFYPGMSFGMYDPNTPHMPMPKVNLALSPINYKNSFIINDNINSFSNKKES